ncbi:MAG: DUF3857 domain-containing protein [Bacteroidota bacterium]
MVDPPVRWGIISDEEQEMETYEYEASAPAVILYDFGVWSPQNWETNTADLKRHVRIKILKPEALSQATQTIFFEDYEKVKGLKAQTIRFVDGKRQLSKLALKQLPDTLLPQGKAKRFYFRDVEVGAILEYEYTLRNVNLECLHPWYFQQDLPVRWSEVRLDEFGPGFYRVQHVGRVVKSIRKTRWRMKHVPSLPREILVDNIDNHRLGLRFFMDFMPLYSEKKKWNEITRILAGRVLYQIDETPQRTLDALFALTQSIIRDAVTEEEKLSRIHGHVSRWMKWNGTWQYQVERDLTTIYRSKKGHSGEINALLYLMLDMAQIPVALVFVSTRAHGKVVSIPSVYHFNHFLVRVKADGQVFHADATSPYRSYQLPPAASLNGSGWLVKDSIARGEEIANEGVHLHRSEWQYAWEGQELKGTFRQQFSGYEATKHRGYWQQRDSLPYLVRLTPSLPLLWKIGPATAKGAHEPEGFMVVEMPLATQGPRLTGKDTIRFNPFLGLTEKLNPFPAGERIFPVDFHYRRNWEFAVRFSVPSGYRLLAVPENKIFVHPERSLRFSYHAQVNGPLVHLEAGLNIKKLSFGSHEYGRLRQFFVEAEKYINQDWVLVPMPPDGQD